MTSTGEFRTTTFTIRGLDCPDEIAELRECLEGVSGVAKLSFNLMRATMTIEHDPSRSMRTASLQACA